MAKRGTKGDFSSPFLLESGSGERGEQILKNGGFLERESATSLQISRLSDRRFASGQEAKLFYAARATRGHRFWGVSTTPRGKGLLLLGYFRF